MLDFDLSYFEEETRDGFTIPAFMKHAWAAQLEMLDKIDRICNEHDIPYFADWGTLLGAVRHKGYIPWDDDIDICMRREDLERFTEVISDYQGIEILTGLNNPDHGFHANRVLNTTLFNAERDFYKEYHGFPFPAGIDIFTLDYVPRDKGLEEEMVEVVKICTTAYHLREWLDENSPTDKEYVQKFAEYKTAIDLLETACNMTFSEEYPTKYEFVVLAEEVSGFYSDEDADFLTTIACLGSGMDYYIPKDAYSSSVRLPFENITIPVPLDYDFILRKKYGDDYMTPRKAESGHEYPFYNKFIKKVFDEDKFGGFDNTFEYVQNTTSRYYIRYRTMSSKATLNISEDELRDEVIGNRTVTERFKRKLAAQCELIEEFKRLCSVLNIHYYAINDTLRYAVDSNAIEDVDNNLHFAVRREDYSTLMSSLPLELDPWFDSENIYGNDSYEDIRIHIRSDAYMCDDRQFAERFHGYDEEVALYISSVDYASSDTDRENMRQGLIKSLISTSKVMPTQPPYSDDILNIVSEWENILQLSINREMSIRREFLKIIDSLSGAMSEDVAGGVRLSEDVWYGVDKIYDIDTFDDTRKMKYAWTDIEVPVRYDMMTEN